MTQLDHPRPAENQNHPKDGRPKRIVTFNPVNPPCIARHASFGQDDDRTRVRTGGLSQ
jgi:hypothetical protein